MPRFEDLEIDQALPSLYRVVTREDVRAYAEVGGDHNPLHQDDEIARAVGFPGIIAHGMFSMGHLAACVTAWVGDPTCIVRLSAQFRAPVFMGEEIVASGRVTDLDPVTRTATAELWVTLERDGVVEYPIRKGAATVRFVN